MTYSASWLQTVENICSAQRLRRVTLAVVLMAVLFGACACGKKPGSVDPPPGVAKSDFPLIYPDPATDPKP